MFTEYELRTLLHGLSKLPGRGMSFPGQPLPAVSITREMNIPRLDEPIKTHSPDVIILYSDLKLKLETLIKMPR